MTPRFIQTPRLRIRYLDTDGGADCGDRAPPPASHLDAASGSRAGRDALVALHGNLASCMYFQPLAAALAPRWRCVAPDLRGYGGSDALPITASAGLADCADDLLGLLDALGLQRVHLLGWSLGGGVALRFTRNHWRRVRSLILVAPVSPCGFGGTRDAAGAPHHPDWAGSGAGLVGAKLLRVLRHGSEADLEKILRPSLVAAGAALPRAAALMRETRLQRLGETFYPGDSKASSHWPGFAPGTWGAMNAIGSLPAGHSGVPEEHLRPSTSPSGRPPLTVSACAPPRGGARVALRR